MARYKLMGYEIEGQEENTRALSRAEQANERSLVCVYETDDEHEAKEIAKAGGFFRDRDNFIAVAMVIDSDDPQPASTPMPRKG